MARICRKVPANAPETFHEMLQYYWFVHLGVITELNTWDSFNPGRLDQHLYPFYKKDIENGHINKRKSNRIIAGFLDKIQQSSFATKNGCYCTRK